MLKKEKYLKEKGITLIALVITIIVLLILAGVTLSALTGNSGILSNAEKAKKDTEQSTLEEEVSLKLMEQELDSGELETYLKQIQNSNIEKIRDSAYKVTRGASELTVYDDGQIITGKVWDGKSSEKPEVKEGNWYIYNATQLKGFADAVNNGTGEITSSTTVYLMADIELGGSYNDEAEVNNEWTPIGNIDNKFVGTFEGKGHTICGIISTQNASVENDESKQSRIGVFGYSTGEIKDLTVKDSEISGASSIGAIVGQTTGNIINCHNINTKVIASAHSVGGIVGTAKENNITDCTNTGIIYIKTDEELSENKGYIGGIIGNAYENVTIKDCKNTGPVSLTINGSCVGGIVGALGEGASIESCNNSALVEGENSYIGGIAGLAAQSTRIQKSNNSGDVKGEGERLGGIVGSIDPGITSDTASTVESCSNSGNVQGGGPYIGGIIGCMTWDESNNNTNLKNCYNSGEVSGTGVIGGIVGLVAGTTRTGTITNCYSKGKVEGTEYTGAIIGMHIASTENIIENLYYFGNEGIGAINGQDVEGAAEPTTKNLKSLDAFKKWLSSL